MGWKKYEMETHFCCQSHQNTPQKYVSIILNYDGAKCTKRKYISIILMRVQKIQNEIHFQL